MAARRELGEGKDTGHHALVRNGSGDHECTSGKYAKAVNACVSL